MCMKLWITETEKVKRQAEEEAVVILQHWRQKVRRLRLYRACLCAVLILACLGLMGYSYYLVDSSIPSVIHVRAESEESLELRIPARGEIVNVSRQGNSNIPNGAVTIDLSRPLTLKTGNTDDLQMQVKLFGILPFKQVGIRVIEDRELIPVGVPIGIYVKTEGVLVVGTGEFASQGAGKVSPAKNILKSGDYVIKLNGTEVTGKDDLIMRIENCGGEEQLLTIRRDAETYDVKIKPEKDRTGKYKIGVWVRDNAQGVGTMTYIDDNGNFGALGHGINDVDTSTLMEMNDGTLYQTEIISIRKGAAGQPGEMTGMIVYSDDRILGDITSNSTRGIFGKCNQKALALGTEDALPIGLKQEIEKGPAQILCTVDGTTRYYDIEITELHLDHDNVNRGIELRVTDPELLSVTGGIVQGMSGAPIIQKEKFVGAVTHVLVQDSTRGYGIFIENMLE
jgi:stage IV sporulation protein B